MKKLLNISVIAALAVLPVAANAARTVEAGDAATGGSTTALATTSYVQGAYNAANSQINALILDTAVSGTGHVNITTGNTVSENLQQLDSAIQLLSSGTDTTIGDLDGLDSSFGTGEGKADTVVEALDSLDGRLDTAESDIDALKTKMGTTSLSGVTGLNSTDVTAAVVELQNDKQEKSDSTITAAQDAAHSLLTEGSNVAGNLVSIAGAVETLNGDANTNGSVAKQIADAIAGENLGTTYQTLNDSNVAAGTYDHLTAGQGVGTNLIALDTAVSTIERKQIPIVSDWSTNTVTNTTISSLSGTVDCTLSANAENPACTTTGD